MAVPVIPLRSTLCRRGTAAEGEALRHEAEILAHARHPGVVELVTVTTVDGTTELVTACPDGRSLGELALSLEEIAGVVAALATTVADLHDIGVAHLRLAADAVTVADDGRVVLGGFADAIRVDGSPASWPRHAAARVDDAALGHLLSELLDRCAPAAVVESWETGRWGRPRFMGRGRGVGPSATMRRWAACAAAGTVPSRRLADGLVTGVPTARLPNARRPPAPRRRGGSFGTAGDVPNRAAPGDYPLDDPGGFLCDNPRADAGAMPSEGGGAADEAMERWLANVTPDPPPVERRAGVAPALGAGPAPPSRWPRAFVAAVIAIVAALVFAGVIADGHRRAARRTGAPGCIVGSSAPTCATYEGEVLTTRGAQFAVGQPGDVVAVGRWRCSEATLALLRPQTGEVWVFDRWPVGDEPVVGSPLGRVPDAIGLGMRASGHCDALLAVRRDGATAVLTGARA
jgi:hypothetical protein